MSQLKNKTIYIKLAKKKCFNKLFLNDSTTRKALFVALEYFD